MARPAEKQKFRRRRHHDQRVKDRALRVIQDIWNLDLSEPEAKIKAAKEYQIREKLELFSEQLKQQQGEIQGSDIATFYPMSSKLWQLEEEPIDDYSQLVSRAIAAQVRSLGRSENEGLQRKQESNRRKAAYKQLAGIGDPSDTLQRSGRISKTGVNESLREADLKTEPKAVSPRRLADLVRAIRLVSVVAVALSISVSLLGFRLSGGLLTAVVVSALFGSVAFVCRVD